ncbi:MAG: alpha/beta fold hydrolase [Myxococcota bacterium]|nr:alpha/beta fold hydrolase [Myxococcota bacterium]
MQWSSPVEVAALCFVVVASLILLGALFYATVTYAFSMAMSQGEHGGIVGRGLLGWALETIMGVAVFLNQGPDLLLRRRWRSRQGSGIPAILLPGYTETQFIFRAIHRRLDRESIPYETYRFRPFLGDPRALARDLGTYIDEVCEARGVEEVDVVGHSMGGLVGRYLLHVIEHPRVRRVVSVGSPHHGTFAAHFGVGEAATQMVPGSPLLTELADSWREDPALLNIRTVHDNIVIPPESSALSARDEVIRSGWCHLGVNFCPEVVALVVAHLRAK